MFEKTRISHPLMLGITLVIIVVTYVAMYMVDAKHFRVGKLSVILSIAHYGCFSIHYGSQFWVSFFAGFIKLKVLPRKWFSTAQSNLFPAYFTVLSLTSMITTATYFIAHPYRTWNFHNVIQIACLFVAFLNSLLNSAIFTPKTNSTLFKMIEIEKEAGYSEKIGVFDKTELKKDSRYAALYSKFILHHTLSTLVNLLGFITNSIYLCYLASNRTV